MLIYYLADLHRHHRILDEVLGLGPGQVVGPIAFGVITALFYIAELTFSPIFGVLSDRIGHHRVMQFGPVFGILAAVATWATTNLPIIGATRVLEGSATASSVPSILGYIAAATAEDEGLRGKAVARFEAATLAGLLSGFVVAGLLFPLLGPTAFLVNGLLYGVSLAIYRFGVDEHLDRTPADGDEASDRTRTGLGHYWKILTGTHVWLLAPTWIAINAVLGLYTTQTLFQMVRARDPRFPGQLLMGGFDSVQVSIGLAIGGALFFAGLIYWGNRFKAIRRTTIILYGLGGGALIAVGAIAVNHSADVPELLRLLLVVPIVLGVFVLAGATPAAIGLLADVTEAYPEDRGAIMGLYSVFLGVGQITGSLIAGLAANGYGLDGVLIASVVLLGLAVAPLLLLRRHEHILGEPGGRAMLA
jgi:MFS family permease